VKGNDFFSQKEQYQQYFEQELLNILNQ